MGKNGKRALAAQRLKQDFPDIHAELVSGRIPSMKKALLKAGLLPQKTAADKLLKAWDKANADERARFLARIGDGSLSAPVAVSEEPPLIANGRYLLPQTVRQIENLMISRNLLPAQVMEEVGFPEEGRALTRAMAKKASLRLTVIAALRRWLQEQNRQIR